MINHHSIYYNNLKKSQKIIIIINNITLREDGRGRIDISPTM
jgi:hypothetical protein